MRLLPNTLFIGKVFHEFDSLDSTNQYALKLLADEKPQEGTVILTHDQYAGRGQLNNKWESEPTKNLTFTTILFPKFLEPKDQFLLNQAVSLSVFDTLKKYIPTGLKIKWPNDIYVFDKKITGILIQNSLQGNSLQSTIVGIGINVNQTQFLSDAPNPTSVALETGSTVSLEDVLATFCVVLERYYLTLKAGQTTILQENYLRNLYRIGQPFHFKKLNGTVFKGSIIGVTPIGKLIIDVNGIKETFAFKEVSYLT